MSNGLTVIRKFSRAEKPVLVDSKEKIRLTRLGTVYVTSMVKDMQWIFNFCNEPDTADILYNPNYQHRPRLNKILMLAATVSNGPSERSIAMFNKTC